MNWGMLPFLYKSGNQDATTKLPFANGDWVYIPNVKKQVAEKADSYKAYAVNASGKVTEFELTTGDMTDDERKIILAGCLINFYKA